MTRGYTVVHVARICPTSLLCDILHFSHPADFYFECFVHILMCCVCVFLGVTSVDDPVQPYLFIFLFLPPPLTLSLICLLSVFMQTSVSSGPSFTFSTILLISFTISFTHLPPSPYPSLIRVSI